MAGEMDAPYLFVLDGLSRRTHMAIDIENSGRLFLYLAGLIEEGRDPQPGQGLIAQFTDAVSGTTLKDIAPNCGSFPIPPLRWCSPKHDLRQEALAESFTFLLPFLERGRLRKGRDAGLDQMAHFFQRCVRL
jgi:hypothetical protein